MSKPYLYKIKDRKAGFEKIYSAILEGRRAAELAQEAANRPIINYLTGFFHFTGGIDNLVGIAKTWIGTSYPEFARIQEEYALAKAIWDWDKFFVGLFTGMFGGKPGEVADVDVIGSSVILGFTILINIAQVALRKHINHLNNLQKAQIHII